MRHCAGAVFLVAFLFAIPAVSEMTPDCKTYDEHQKKVPFGELLRSAERGEAGAQYALAREYDLWHYCVSRDTAEAAKWYRMAGNQGHTQAQGALGSIYYLSGAPGSKAEAAVWYRKAADNGNMYALEKMGDMYYRGEGVPLDRDEAIRWYQKMADTTGHLPSNTEVRGLLTPRSGYFDHGHGHPHMHPHQASNHHHHPHNHPHYSGEHHHHQGTGD